jgi:hypothetical protein
VSGVRGQFTGIQLDILYQATKKFKDSIKKSYLRCTRFFILPQEIQAIKFLFLSSFFKEHVF